MPYSREKIVLENGLRVLLDHRPSSQSVAITCLVRAGSQHDFPGKHGLAHVVEHLLFRTRCGEDGCSVLKAIEDIGGQADAGTAIDRTIFSVHVHRDDTIPALGRFAEVICDLPSDPASLELEKVIVAHELQLEGQEWQSALQRSKYILLGGDETLQHFVVGDGKYIRRIEMEDVQAFYRQHYTAGKMVLALVGGMDPQKTTEAVTKLFRRLPPGNGSARPQPLQAVGPTLRVERTSANLLAIFFRCPSFEDFDLASLELAGDMLAVGSHSSLFQRLREKNALIYAINGSLQLSAGFGSLDIFTATNPWNNHRVLTIIFEEIEQLLARPLAAPVLSAAKTRLIKRQILTYNDVREASKWYAERELLVLHDQAGDFKMWMGALERITPEDFQKAMRSLCDPANCFVYVMGHLWPWHRSAILRAIRAMGKPGPAPPPAAP